LPSTHPTSRPGGSSRRHASFQQLRILGEWRERVGTESGGQQHQLTETQALLLAVGGQDAGTAADADKDVETRAVATVSPGVAQFELVDVEVLAFDQPPQAAADCGFDARYGFLRLDVLKVDALQRFIDVKLARSAIKADAAPIVDPVRGVGILLDF